MNTWKIFKYNPYEFVIVKANSFDEALEKARQINPNFNGGQIIKEDYKER